MFIYVESSLGRRDNRAQKVQDFLLGDNSSCPVGVAVDVSKMVLIEGLVLPIRDR